MRRGRNAGPAARRRIPDADADGDRDIFAKKGRCSIATHLKWPLHLVCLGFVCAIGRGGGAVEVEVASI